MPLLISDVVTPGSLARQPQPVIPAEGGLVLRPWKDEDAPAVHEVFQDPLMRRWHHYASESVAEALGMIEGWRAAWEGEANAYWAVAGEATDQLLGRAALRHVALPEGTAEVAYWTASAARGRGIAPRAVTALTRWAFESIGFHRLELTHAVHNEASCRVAEKTGFALEGTKRSALLHPDGWHDMHLHARIA
ncbi:GNAT family N-acetyltransferase [Streptomyces sp. RY43-2]|uniref:GNAT family N-acetyltransferase n=1 Tax=Streptomyces macrolidinus TaxID=2952607 RepID=A0ABT0ZAU9_9ACTN|nr:GNAT family N-acetyltransferase [Streptomyces macrolidinus]MCN9240889.1 GNAT family N-acetyltransferase [Streptomyces macrolidinus]